MVEVCPEIFSGSTRHPRRHVLRQHLPWWFAADTACWVCRRQFGSAQPLAVHLEHDPQPHPMGYGFTRAPAKHWCYLMNGLLLAISFRLGVRDLFGLTTFVRQRLHQFSTTRRFSDSEVDLLRRYNQEFGGSPTTSRAQLTELPSANPASLMHWRTLVTFLNLGHLDGITLGDERAHYPDGRPWPAIAAVPVSSQRRQEPPQREEVVEFIDSHCHMEKVLHNFHQPSLRSLEESLPVAGTAVLLKAVSNFVFPGISQMVEKYITDQRLVYTVGIHPSCVKQFRPLSAAVPELERHLQRPVCVGLGEVGYDFTKATPRALQERCLRTLLPLARKYGKVLVLHSRADISGMDSRSADALLDLLIELGLQDLPIHFHCFSHSRAVAERWMAACPSVRFGFTALVMRSAHIAEVATFLPAQRILLETDAPFLPPPGVPAMRNHPWSIPAIARHVARLRNESLLDVLHATNANACGLYSFPTSR